MKSLSELPASIADAVQAEKSRGLKSFHTWFGRRAEAMTRVMTYIALTETAANPKLYKHLAEGSPRAINSATTAMRDAQWRRHLLEQQESAIFDPEALPDKLRVCDPFAGSGNIASAAAELGCDVYASDIDPVAYHMLRATLLFPPKLDRRSSGEGAEWNGLEAEVFKWADIVQARVTAETRHLYEGNDSNCLWLAILNCRCGLRRAAVREFKVPGGTIVVSVSNSDVRIKMEKTSARVTPSDVPTCEGCGGRAADSSLAYFALVGRIIEGTLILPDSPTIYHHPTTTHSEAIEPENTLPDMYRVLNRYHMNKFTDLFTVRQLQLMRSYVRAINDVCAEVSSAYSPKYSEAVVTYLASFLAHVAERNSILCKWDSARRSNTRAFQATLVSPPRLFLEVHPSDFLSTWTKRVMEVMHSRQRLRPAREVKLADATLLPYPDNYFDAMVTAPPYYDNLNYGQLSAFYWFWERQVLQQWTPVLKGEFGRLESSGKSREEFERGMELTLRESIRTLKPGCKLALCWQGHSQADFEKLIPMAEEAGFQVVRVIPVVLENPQKSGLSSPHSDLIIFLRKPVSAASINPTMREPAATLQQLTEGKPILYEALADLLIEHSDEESIGDLLPVGTRGSHKEMLMEVLADQDPLEFIERLLGTVGVRRLVKSLGLGAGPGATGQLILDHFGFKAAPLCASPGPAQALEILQGAIAKLTNVEEKAHAKGLFQDSCLTLENLVRLGIAAWAQLAFGANWKQRLITILEKNGRSKPLTQLSFGDIALLFRELPTEVANTPLSSVLIQKFGRPQPYLPKAKPAKLQENLDNFVVMRNRVEHDKENYWSSQTLATLRPELIKVLKEGIDFIAAAVKGRAVPRMGTPLCEVRDRLGRLTYKLRLDDGSEVEFRSSQSWSLEHTQHYFGTDTNPKPVDPVLISSVDLLH